MKSVFNKIFNVKKSYNRDTFYYARLFRDTIYPSHIIFKIKQLYGVDITKLKQSKAPLSKEKFIEKFCEEYGYRKDLATSALTVLSTDIKHKKIFLSDVGNFNGEEKNLQ